MACAKELLCMIQDLRNTVLELKQSYKDRSLPVTDGSRELQGLCAQLEFLLQFDLKEKRSFFGQRRDYWDFLCQGLTGRRQGHEGVQFVSCLEKLRTPVGKGRAFIRYCLVHRQLAESLQLCFLDPQLTSEWYFARSPFLHPHLRADIMGCLYELDGIAFHLALKRPDLDAAWPMVSETLSRCSAQSPVNSQMEGTAWPVGNPDGGCEPQHGVRRIPKEESQLLGLVSRSPGPSTNDQHQPGLEKSRDGPTTAASFENEVSGRQVGSQHQGSEVAGDSWQQSTSPASGEQEAELQWANLGEELRHSLATAPELESLLGQQEKPHSEGREATQHFGRQLEEQARQIKDLQDSKAFLSDTLEEMDALASTLRHQLSQREEEIAAMREERRELEARLVEGERRQEELAERLSQARHDAEREAAVATEARAQRVAAAEALEEAERRLRAESRRHLSGAEAQDLRHQQLLSRCRRLEEKLNASEGQLEEKEAQLMALQSQMQLGEPNSSLQRDPKEETEATLEGRLRQAELQAEGLREKLERGLSERKEWEMEREALLESAVSQGQSLAAAQLEAQDLREELEEQRAKLQEALAGHATLASQVAEAAASFTSKRAQMEAQWAEERASHERAVAELKRRLVASEEQTHQEREKGTRLQKEEQRLRAMLLQASEERDILARQAQTMAAALESHAREAALLRSQLEELKASSQREETRLQDALAQWKEEGDRKISALREEGLQLQQQLQRLDLEKQRAANSLEQARGQLSTAQEEKDALEEMFAQAAAELERAGEGGRPEAGGEESMELARGGGLVEEKAAGQAGPEMDKQAMPEDLEAAARREKAGAEHRPRKGIEEMVKLLTAHLEKAKGDAQQKRQLLTAKEEEMKHLVEQLGRARQDGECFRVALERTEKDAKEREKKHQEQMAEQKELVRDMKGRLLELLREKDALWQKTEGINPVAPGAAPRELGLCARCNQDFRFLSRRYQCRLCWGPVCQACSVESGRRGRCCLLCWQKRNFKGT
uniref:RUN and FYVE domain-containing protein 4 n=1 Tax=Pelusios castaneus TaxID=367368 RepID=A0A8C8RGT0_9SAUR